jgi:cyanophycin synthetase
MFDLTEHPRLLKLLALFDRLRAFLGRRNAGRLAAEGNLAAFYAQIWKEAAETIGATIEDLGLGVYEIRRGAARTRVVQNSTSLDDRATFCITRSKPVIYGLLNRHGLRTPRYAVFSLGDMRPAVALLETVRGDCVVKPGSGSGGGRGVTTGIRTRWQLARAAYDASLFSEDILIEEQVAGANYRLLYLDGKLLDAVLRKPPSVRGDGRSSVLRLVRALNAQRLAHGPAIAHCLLTIDMDMTRTLAKQGYTLASVSPDGARVKLKTAINENAGADNRTVVDQLGEALIAEGARAAALAGVRLAGVDVITDSPRLSLQEAGGVILEVNTPPGYYWHYHKQDGVNPLAVHVLNALLTVSAPRELCPVGPARGFLEYTHAPDVCF